MVQFKEITNTEERKPIYTDKRVVLPRLTKHEFGTPAHREWMDNNYWMIDYQVHMDDKERATELSLQLDSLFDKNPKHKDIPSIIAQLRELRLPEMKDQTPLYKWTRSAHQMIRYADNRGIRDLMAKRLGNRYSGLILEAMCGSESYFDDPSSDTTIISLDYCEASLERHMYPDRKRICCDLDQIRRGKQLPIFEDNQLDAISICFGIKYPRYIKPLMREFLRILKPGGTLSFFENQDAGYRSIQHRGLDLLRINEMLRDSGYSSVKFNHVRMSGFWNDKRGKFYHIEAVK